MSEPQADSRFPHEVSGGVYVFIGGRSDAESADFLLNNNVRIIICATGIHNRVFEYPLEIVADKRRFQHFKFAIGFESPVRDRCDVNEPTIMSSRPHVARYTVMSDVWRQYPHSSLVTLS